MTSSVARAFVVLSAVVAAGLLSAAPSIAALAPPGPAVSGGTAAATTPGPPNDARWVARYDFALEVDGKPSPDACFYQELDSRRILISAPEVSKICIVTQEGKLVTAVERSKVKVEKASDSALLLPGAEAGAATTTYSIEPTQGSVIFYVGPNRIKIMPKQPLIGPTGADEILRHSPLYKKGRDEYAPQPEEISYLKSYRTPVEIEVFFGTWCPHCKVLVPKFMKTMLVAANPNLKVSYHGVPQGFATYDPAKAKDVKGIPTFIFWKDGKEVGRIPGEPTDGTIEHAVAQILRTIAK